MCTSTLLARAQGPVEAARRAGRLWEVDTGHDLMITEPGFVADTLMAIAADGVAPGSQA